MPLSMPIWGNNMWLFTDLFGMIDFTHIIDFATQLPHPSDIGLVKPSDGLNIAAALFGVCVFIGLSQLFYYGLPQNDFGDNV